MCGWPGGWRLGGGLRALGQCFRRSGCMCVAAVGWLAGAPVDGVLGWVAVAAVVCFLRVGAGCGGVWMGRLLRMRLGGLVRMRLGGLVPRSLGWNCALGVGGWCLSPPCAGYRGVALLGLGLGSGLAAV